LLVLLGALCLAVSCGQGVKENDEQPTAARRTVESDFVVLDDGPAQRSVAEQTLVTEPPPPQRPEETKAPPVRRPRATTATIASIEEKREESEATLERRRAPHERASTHVVPKPRDADRNREPTQAPIYNPRFVTPGMEPTPPPLVLTDVPTNPRDRERDRSAWTPSEIMLGVGTLSTLTGAVAAAGDGNPDARIFGVTMLGIGLVSYGTAGILYLNEQKPAAATTKKGVTSVSVGPGVIVRGAF
jgi:hypothetical protein